MAQNASESILEALREGLEEEIHLSLCSRTGELISALPEHDIEKARQIAVVSNVHDSREGPIRESVFTNTAPQWLREWRTEETIH
jgi:hypothetical protein